MRNPRNLTRWAGLVAGPVLAATVLSGCGVAGTSWNPGVAAEVGDQVVTTDRVDEVATDYCTAVSDQVAAEGTVLPLSFFKTGIAGQLALMAAAEQLADLYDVEPAGEYAERLAQLRDAVAGLPEDVQESVIAVETSSAYTQGVALAIGEKELRDRGASPSPQEASALGQQIFVDWLAEHPVDLNPRYGIAVVDGAVAPVDTSLSVAVGETAQQGTLQQPDASYTSGLPSSQRCG